MSCQVPQLYSSSQSEMLKRGVGALLLGIDEIRDCPHSAGERTEAPGVSEVEPQREVQGWDHTRECVVLSPLLCCLARVPERSRLPEFPSFKLM